MAVVTPGHAVDASQRPEAVGTAGVLICGQIMPGQQHHDLQQQYGYAM